MADEIKKYIVYWTWKKEDTEKGIDLAEGMDRKRAESPRSYPKSLGASYTDSSAGFTIFEATEEQLERWLKHYEEVVQVTEIKPIMSAKEFKKKYREGKITWKFWHKLR